MLENTRTIYFVGIGGIGMSALAQLLAYKGKYVLGSDAALSPVTEMLKEKGITVFHVHSARQIPADTGALIYSDAVPETNVERTWAREQGIPQLSYFEALGAVTAQYYTIAVAGTHGKTTTTGMIAKILSDAEKKPTSIIGSLVRDFGSNFVPGNNDVFVVEACEYRNHLLELSPKVLVITNIEWDHTDFFLSLEAVQKTFKKAAMAVPSDGIIVTSPYAANIKPVIEEVSARVVDYTPTEIPDIQLVGEFNRMNARAAKAAIQSAFPDIPESAVDGSLSNFQGAWRRFERKGKTKTGALVYDDYAHHPTEIRETLRAVRKQFPDRTIIVAFHPHLYSRTKDLLDGFAEALRKADKVLIAPIYAAREKSDPDISNEILSKAIESRGGNASAYASLDRVKDALEGEPASALIITMGAGDIFTVADNLVGNN